MKIATTVAAFLCFVQSSLAAPAAEPGAHIERRALATVYSSCKHANTVALTFDDGPYIYETDIVSLLNSNGIKGTFFVNGNNYDCIYDQRQVTSLKNAFNSGHMIGSHTWAHLDLSAQSWDKIHDEMWRVEQAMQKILGVTPNFMRPPYGNYNDLVRSASSIRNQSLVIWDFDSGDSLGHTATQSKNDYQALINKHPNNILPLNHETVQTTSTSVLPFIIPKLKAAGYKFDTVAGCLGLSPYHSVGQAGTRDSTWHC
ncbi:carbohydrate esterase family 4 protein [Rickenella mellea]|uniref:Carbohydrate esterase family 4 protein n=1 Tax=Rickenella mellea TaxID=50990 RepID=A0A4Y7QCX4_9AGAM|nr:carbohydrate esterase family 4 protein [Rickenella mellea]